MGIGLYGFNIYNCRCNVFEANDKTIKKQKHQASIEAWCFGAGGRGRTDTVSLPLDFECFKTVEFQRKSAPLKGNQRTPQSLDL